MFRLGSCRHSLLKLLLLLLDPDPDPVGVVLVGNMSRGSEGKIGSVTGSVNGLETPEGLEMEGKETLVMGVSDLSQPCGHEKPWPPGAEGWVQSIGTEGGVEEGTERARRGGEELSCCCDGSVL